MPSIELGPARPIGAVDVRTVRPQGGQASKSERRGEAASVAVVRDAALDPGDPPIDTERVAQVRKAVESGTYPLVPARVADAMIAAGILLRSARP